MINAETHLETVFLTPSLSIGTAFQCCENCSEVPEECPRVTVITLSFLVFSIYVSFGGES